MKLYSGPLSLFSMKTRVAMGEKGLAHELVQVGWSRTARYEPHHPDVVALNPKRQVPVLVDGDVVVYDSTLIGEYLEDRYPEPPLMPRDPAGRVRCRKQEAAADEIWFPHVWTLIEGVMYRSAADEGRVGSAVQAFGELAAAFDAGLGDRPYWCGDFSFADIGTFVMVNAAAGLGAPLPPELARMHAGRKRVEARPAVRAVFTEVQEAAARAFAA
jgi:glutathione S-transferase